MRSAGSVPVLIPPRLDLVLPIDTAARAERLQALVALLDGVIGLGGDDLDPALYGEANRFAEDVNPLRDRAEIELVRTAFDAELYMFGICRSHQLWNVARSGSLIQDIERQGYAHYAHDNAKHGLSVGEPIAFDTADGGRCEHRVLLTPGSQAAGATGVESLTTNARHHQAVKVPGFGLEVTGVVPDPVKKVDLIEVTEDWHSLSVQFHPENMDERSAAFRLLAAGTRRPLVFHMKKAIEREGSIATADLLARRMRARGDFFEPSDHAWMKERLAPRLEASAPAPFASLSGARGEGSARPTLAPRDLVAAGGGC